MCLVDFSKQVIGNYLDLKFEIGMRIVILFFERIVVHEDFNINYRANLLGTHFTLCIC